MSELTEPIDTYDTAQLERLFLDTMVKLRLCSTQGAAAIGGNESARPHPTSRPPAGDNGKESDGLLARWRGCNTDDDRRAVVRAALRELHEIQYSPDPERRPGSREWKMKVAQDVREVLVVARVYGVTSREVRKLRRAFRAGKLNA